MEQTFSSLHPNPGWANFELGNRSGAHNASSEDMVGKHCILELYGCDQTKLNDEAFVRTRVTYASKIAGAKLLNLITYRFQPQGVTGLALLAESHISVHTWPESRYAAIDVFTCGQETMPEKACELLAKELGSNKFSLKSNIDLIEVYDNSHIQGNDSVGALIAFGNEGFNKRRYRK